MKKLLSAFLLPFLLVQAMPLAYTASAQEAAKIIQQSQASATPLSNLDVIRMVKADFAPETIIAQIKSSACNFATTPAALRQLKEEAVPDAVILAMVMAPRPEGARNHVSEAPERQKNVKVKIPNGLSVEVESPYSVSSQDVKKGEAISFRVVNPVKVDGVLVIEPGATATGRVVLAQRGGHFGRAGRLAWAMEYVTAVDGTRIPLQAAGRIVGDSKAAKVITQTIAMGALLWMVAPVALFHGFKRGENAVLPAGKRLEVITQGDASVSGTTAATY
jgi:predicted metal-binding protein